MYIYAFLQTPTTPLDLPEGLSQSLELVSDRTLSAVVEPGLTPESIQSGDERFQLRAILSHDRVLRELFTQVDVLPVPFGTFLLSREKLMDYLNAHQTEYGEKLETFAGKAEYTLKLTPLDLPEPTVESSGKGKDYFLAKKRRYQVQAEQQQEQQQQKQQVIEAIAQAYPNNIHSEPKDGVERVYILCDRTDEEPLLQQVQTLQANCPTWTLQLTEALPPYHFVN